MRAGEYALGAGGGDDVSGSDDGGGDDDDDDEKPKKTMRELIVAALEAGFTSRDRIVFVIPNGALEAKCDTKRASIATALHNESKKAGPLWHEVGDGEYALGAGGGDESGTSPDIRTIALPTECMYKVFSRPHSLQAMRMSRSVRRRSRRLIQL